MSFDRDFLDLGILFEDVGDFSDECIGTLGDDGFAGSKVNGIVDFDGSFSNFNTSWDTTLAIRTFLVRATVKPLALREVGLEILIVDPRIAVAVTIGIGITATIRIGNIRGIVRAEVNSFADCSIFVSKTFFGDPRIAEAVAIVIGIRCTIVILEAIEIFAFIGALIGTGADIGIFVGKTVCSHPRIADTVGIVIDIGASVFIFKAVFVFGAINAFIRAFADACKRFLEAIFDDPRIADAIAVTIGIRATVESLFAGNILAIINIIEDTVTIGIGNDDDRCCIATETEAESKIRTSIRKFVHIGCVFVALEIIRQFSTEFFVVREG